MPERESRVADVNVLCNRLLGASFMSGISVVRLISIAAMDMISESS